MDETPPYDFRKKLGKLGRRRDKRMEDGRTRGGRGRMLMCTAATPSVLHPRVSERAERPLEIVCLVSQSVARNVTSEVKALGKGNLSSVRE